MIRRGFWLAVGAASGIYGYRRVSAVGRRLSASLNPAPPAALEQAKQSKQSKQGTQGTQSARRAAITAARETYRFARDVREGMDLYAARQSRAESSNLSADQTMTHEPKDGH